jgi:hypothetical protein
VDLIAENKTEENEIRFLEEEKKTHRLVELE